MTENKIQYNPLTDSYDTPDGTRVSAMLTENVSCIADMFNILRIRDNQRKVKTQVAIANAKED